MAVTNNTLALSLHRYRGDQGVLGSGGVLEDTYPRLSDCESSIPDYLEEGFLVP